MLPKRAIRQAFWIARVGVRHLDSGYPNMDYTYQLFDVLESKYDHLVPEEERTDSMDWDSESNDTSSGQSTFSEWS